MNLFINERKCDHIVKIIDRINAAKTLKEILLTDKDLSKEKTDYGDLNSFLEIRDYYIMIFATEDMWRLSFTDGGGWDHVRTTSKTKKELEIIKNLYVSYLEEGQFNYFTEDMITCILRYPLLYDELKKDLSWCNIDLMFDIFKEWTDIHEHT